MSLLTWPLHVPRMVIRSAKHVWANIVDVVRFVQGLATCDAPRTRYLLNATTDGKPLRMMLTCPGHIEDELRRSGCWEPHVARALAFFVRSGGTFVDIGANIGYHALWVARSRPDARVMCFEPNPGVRAELDRNVALNDLDNVEVRSCALGDREGTVEFHAQTGRSYNRGSSSVLKNPNVGIRYETISVTMRMLDHEVGPDLRVDLLKIDTEGLEVAVLRGARALIARCRPIVVFEFESRFMKDPGHELRQLQELLPQYTLWTLSHTNAVLAPFDPATVASRFYRADLIALPDPRRQLA